MTTLRAYAFVGAEVVPGGPFVGRGETFDHAFTDTCGAVAHAISSAHRAAIAETPPDGHVLTMTVILGGAADDERAIFGTLAEIRRTTEEE